MRGRFYSTLVCVHFGQFKRLTRNVWCWSRMRANAHWTGWIGSQHHTPNEKSHRISNSVELAAFEINQFDEFTAVNLICNDWMYLNHFNWMKVIINTLEMWFHSRFHRCSSFCFRNRIKLIAPNPIFGCSQNRNHMTQTKNITLCPK